MEKHKMTSVFDFGDGVRQVMITGHVRPDGDCVGSCMGLYHYLTQTMPGVHVDVRLESVPEAYQLIKDTDRVITTSEDDKTYDVFMSLDASDTERFAPFKKYFDSAKRRICIDHHISNKGFADENIICPELSSTSETLMTLMREEDINAESALALYIGIICDTGVFKHSNTSRRTMDAAGLLMEKGIDYSTVIDDVFYRKTWRQNRLMGECLIQSVFIPEEKMIYSVVTAQMYAAYQADHDDLEGIIDQLRVTKGVETAVLISENAPLLYKVSMRSNKTVDVAAIAAPFGGGGHVRAAGCTMSGTQEEIIALLRKGIKEQM